MERSTNTAERSVVPAIERLIVRASPACRYQLPGCEQLLMPQPPLTPYELSTLVNGDVAKVDKLHVGQACASLRQLVGSHDQPLVPANAIPAMCGVLEGVGCHRDHRLLEQRLAEVIHPGTAGLVLRLLRLLQDLVSESFTPRAIAQQWAPLLGLNTIPAEETLFSWLSQGGARRLTTKSEASVREAPKRSTSAVDNGVLLSKHRKLSSYRRAATLRHIVPSLHSPPPSPPGEPIRVLVPISMGQPLGIGIGTDDDGDAVIANIELGSPADRCGELHVADRILKINGRSIAEGTEVVDVSDYVSPRATTVEVIVMSKSDDPTGGSSDQARFLTRLEREQGHDLGMGLGFQGSSVVVTSIRENSPADKANLKQGDIIESVGGEKLTRDNLRSILTTEGDAFMLSVLREKQPDSARGRPQEHRDSSTPANAEGRHDGLEAARGLTHYVTVLKKTSLEESLGMGYHFTSNETLAVTSVEPNSPAHRADIQVGDIIASVAQERVDRTNWSSLLTRPQMSVELGVIRERGLQHGSNVQTPSTIQPEVGSYADTSADDGRLVPSDLYYTLITRQPGESLGVGLGFDRGKVVVTTVKEGSLADNANIQEGDVIATVNGKALSEGTIELLTGGESHLELGVMREEEEDAAQAEAATFYTTIMRQQPGQELGISLGYDADKTYIVSVAEGSPADFANLQEGDVLVSANGVRITPDNVADCLRPELFSILLGVSRDLLDGQEVSAAPDLATDRVPMTVEGSLMWTNLGQTPGVPSGLGVELQNGVVTVSHIEPLSAAERANLQRGDRVLRVDDVSEPAAIEALLTRPPWQTRVLSLGVQRLLAESTSVRVYKTVLVRQPGQPLGFDVGFDGELVVVTSVSPGSAADAANVSVGDVVQMVNDQVLRPHNVGVLLRRDINEFKLRVLRDESSRGVVFYTTLSRRLGQGLGLRLSFVGEVARVGYIKPGSPAEASGLRVADEIVTVNGQALSVSNLTTLLSDDHTSFELEVVRDVSSGLDSQGNDVIQFITLHRAPAEAWGIGLGEGPHLTLVTEVVPDSPAQKAGLLPGDRIASVGRTDATVENILTLLRAESNAAVLGIIRPSSLPADHLKNGSDSLYYTKISRPPGQSWGMGLADGAREGALLVSEVNDHSPAARANLRPGDRIVSVDGKTVTDETTDVLLSDAQLEIQLGVQRFEDSIESRMLNFYHEDQDVLDTFTNGSLPQSILTWADDDRNQLFSTSIERAPGQNMGLGLTYEDGKVIVQSVLPGSPADQANLHTNDVIVSINGQQATSENVRALLNPTATSFFLGVVRRTSSQVANAPMYLSVVRSPGKSLGLDFGREGNALVVENVQPGSPAAMCNVQEGLHVGDVIFSINGVAADASSDLNVLIPRVVDKFVMGILRRPDMIRPISSAEATFITVLSRNKGQELGMSLEFGPSGEVMVIAVNTGSPADDANLQVGDRILEVDGVNAAPQTLGALFPPLRNTFELSVVRYLDDDPFDGVEGKRIEARIERKAGEHIGAAALMPTLCSFLQAEMRQSDCSGMAFVTEVEEGSPAALHPELHVGAQVVHINGVDITPETDVTSLLAPNARQLLMGVLPASVEEQDRAATVIQSAFKRNYKVLNAQAEREVDDDPTSPEEVEAINVLQQAQRHF
ncbi:hypothetical protein AB1Y20_002083 [Prymnesium parvum]|uniref:PDZ domain-containing protein n=1 Tax=Prymnesium parvum TaxID=97485 RepID=A0AB34J7X9_PRYPA